MIDERKSRDARVRTRASRVTLTSYARAKLIRATNSAADASGGDWEEIFGEIEDEHDLEEDKFWTLEKPGCYLAFARTPLDEFEAEIDASLTDDDEIDEEDIDTLGGLVFMLSGRVPARGEVVTHPAGYEFEVVDADPRRIKRLRVRVPE